MYEKYQYISDPHTAIAYAIYKKQEFKGKTILLSTAHPAKFKSSVEDILKIEIPIPERLSILKKKQKRAISMDVSLNQLKSILLNR